MKLTKNGLPDKYTYSAYNIRFDSRSGFLFTDESSGKNVIVIRADTRLFVHIDNTYKYIFILGENPTHWLDDTKLTAKAKYPINFRKSGKIPIQSKRLWNKWLYTVFR